MTLKLIGEDQVCRGVDSVEGKNMGWETPMEQQK